MNKLSTLIFTTTIAVCFIMASCNDQSGKSKTSAADADSIRVVFNQLADSTTATWKTMIDEDDQKIAYLKRLLDEVSYTKVYDKKAYDSLTDQVNKLKENRYDLTSMASSEKIDEYDNSTSLVIYNVISFAQDHPNYNDYPLMNELIKDIVEADNKVIYHRVDYDNVAISYNKFVDQHKDLLLNSNKPLSHKPLFQLSE